MHTHTIHILFLKVCTVYLHLIFMLLHVDIANINTVKETAIQDIISLERHGIVVAILYCTVGLLDFFMSVTIFL